MSAAGWGDGEGRRGPDAGPPRWAVALLRRVIRRRVVRDDVLASLAIEFAEMSRARGGASARRWYVRQAMGVAVRAVAGTLGREVGGRTGRSLSARSSGPGWDNVRLALRSAWHRRTVSVAVIVAVALGIGATTAVVSVADALLLRPLPYPDPDRLVQLNGSTDDGTLTGMANPYDVVDWKAASRSFEAIAPYTTYETTVVLDDGPVRVRVDQVGEGMDRVLGIHAAQGRLFDGEDYAPGARSVVLGHRFWADRLGADPSIVGRSISLGGTAFTVVGVLPASALPLPGPAGLWLPLTLPTDEGGDRRAGVWLRVSGRLKPGVSVGRAGAEMEAVAARLRQDHPTTNKGRHVDVVSMRDEVVGAARPMVRLLAVAVGLVLLIACANIGNLLLAVAQDRRRELAIRAALGSGMARIAHMILAESALLALTGGALGILLAPAAIRALVALYPGGLPRAAEVGVNGTVLVVALAATAAATFAAGLPPLMEARRLDLQKTLRAGERGLGSRHERRTRTLLVTAQVALSVALLVAGGLLLRTFDALLRVDPGFDVDGVLTFNVALSSTRYPDIAQEGAFNEALVERIDALPGVLHAGTSGLLPLAPGDYLDGFHREGYVDEMPDIPIARVQPVSAGYVETLGLRLIEGRALEMRDRADAPLVVLVNEALQRKYYPGGALGKRMRLQGEWREIVGVVADKHHRGLREEPAPDLYVPRGQISNPRSLAWVVVRTSGDPMTLVAPIRSLLAEMDPMIALEDPALLADRLSAAVAPERFRAVLVGTLALLAFALAVLGIYGLVAYTVARASREIGIHIALGRTPRGVVRGTVGRALALAGGGVATGLVLALVGGRFLAAFVPEVGTHDPLTLVVVPLAFLAVSALAALGPARRAGRVDPAVTLRGD